MAYGDEIHHESLKTRRGSIFWWTNRRKIETRRRKVQSIRLGGKKPLTRRGIFLVRLFRRIKLRWLKLKYSRMLKRMKDFYYSVVKNLIEAGATLETVQQQIMMDTYFTVPVMGVSVASIPTRINYQTGFNRVHSNK